MKIKTSFLLIPILLVLFLLVLLGCEEEEAEIETVEEEETEAETMEEEESAEPEEDEIVTATARERKKLIVIISQSGWDGFEQVIEYFNPNIEGEERKERIERVIVRSVIAEKMLEDMELCITENEMEKAIEYNRRNHPEMPEKALESHSRFGLALQKLIEEVPPASEEELREMYNEMKEREAVGTFEEEEQKLAEIRAAIKVTEELDKQQEKATIKGEYEE